MAHSLDSKERTGDIKLNENVDFSQMLFSDQTFDGLKEAGFKYPSPIQLAAIPLGRCGLDLIIQAKSGTGKTLVFAVVALEMINTNTTATQVLVMAPTREIAYQIGMVIKSVGCKMTNLKIHTFIGGTCLEKDKSNLRICHIAIGTPGRVKQLIELKVLKTNHLKLFILDEADQLLNSQFMECIVQIYKFLPSSKQVIALSATYSDDDIDFVKKLTISPSFVMLDKESPSLIGVKQFVYCMPFSPHIHIRHQKKVEVLCKIISYLKFNQCIIFSNSQFRAETLCNQLSEKKWSVSYMSGAQQQKERLSSFQALCTHKCRIMVSTDLSARGLDSEHVNLVINLDLPSNQATYLHRIGRAGRYGSLGYAISFASEGDEFDRFRDLVTELNLHVKVLPKNFNKFEKLQIRSSTDYSKLEAFNNKIENNYVPKATEGLQDDMNLAEYVTSTEELAAVNATKHDVNGIETNEVKSVGINIVNSYESMNNATLQSDNLVTDMEEALSTSLHGASVMPLIKTKTFKPVSISYDEILKQTCQIDIEATKQKDISVPLYRSLIDNLPSVQSYNVWKSVIDNCGSASTAVLDTCCIEVSPNVQPIALNLETTQSVPTGDAAVILSNAIVNGNVKKSSTIEMEEGSIVEHVQPKNTHHSFSFESLNNTSKENSNFNFMAVKEVQSSFDSISLTATNQHEEDNGTVIGKWVTYTRNKTALSNERKQLDYHEGHSYSIPRHMDSIQQNRPIDGHSDYGNEFNHGRHKVVNFMAPKNSSDLCDTNSEKFMEMMNYTRSLGRFNRHVICANMPSKKLTSEFFNENSIELAEKLLGKLLVRKVNGERISGYIVETEAYAGVTDGASHSFRGKCTARNQAMFMLPGTSYVFIIYGMYSCFNISAKDEGACILIRALEPHEGIAQMMENRKQKRFLKETNLCSGPSKLCQALYINKAGCNEENLANSEYFWLEDDGKLFSDVIRTTRIGIESTGHEWISKPWRFYVKGNKHVSSRNKMAEKFYEENHA